MWTKQTLETSRTGPKEQKLNMKLKRQMFKMFRQNFKGKKRTQPDLQGNTWARFAPTN